MFVEDLLVFECILVGEEALRRLSKSSITEILSFSRPPLGCQLVLEGVAVLLRPSNKKLDWIELRRWLRSESMSLVSLLISFDKNQISDDQLERLTALLSREECRPDRMSQTSAAGYELCLWLQAMVQYGLLCQHLRSQQNTQ